LCSHSISLVTVQIAAYNLPILLNTPVVDWGRLPGVVPQATFRQKTAFSSLPLIHVTYLKDKTLFLTSILDNRVSIKFLGYGGHNAEECRA